MGVRGRPLEFLRTSPLAKNESSSSTSSSSSRFFKALGFLVAEWVFSKTFFLFLPPQENFQNQPNNYADYTYYANYACYVYYANYVNIMQIM